MEYVESRIFFATEVEELIFSLKRELPHHRVLQEAVFRVGDHARAALCKAGYVLAPFRPYRTIVLPIDFSAW